MIAIGLLTMQLSPEARGNRDGLHQDLLRIFSDLVRLPDWTMAEEPTVFSRSDLFEYMNGAAPQYLYLGFRTLHHARFAFRGDEFSSVVVDVFDMGSRLGAYGAYTSGRTRQVVARPWGAEGYRAGTLAAAWKGSIYVHASADEDKPQLTAMLERMVRRVTESLPDGKGPPEIVRMLPSGFVRNSDCYVGKDLFGHAFLPSGLVASYRMGGSEAQLFISPFEVPEEAESALQQLLEYETKSGGKPISESRPSPGGFWVRDPGLDLGFVTRKGRNLVGIWGVSDKNEALRLVREVLDRSGG